MHRGRRDREHLAEGDVLDCWRVEAYEPDARLRLAAEMKVPGRAWLQFDVAPRGGGGSTVRQTAVFDAAGLLGRCYWHALYRFHRRAVQGASAEHRPAGCQGAVGPGSRERRRETGLAVGAWRSTLWLR